MTIINDKKDQLQIIIATTFLEEQKEKFIRALTASVRWYSCLNEGDIRTLNKQDAYHLYNVSELINSVMLAEVDAKKKTLQVSIKTTSPAEQRDIIMQALTACTRWYGCIDEEYYKSTNKEDGQYLMDISELISNLIPVQIID